MFVAYRYDLHGVQNQVENVAEQVPTGFFTCTLYTDHVSRPSMIYGALCSLGAQETLLQC